MHPDEHLAITEVKRIHSAIERAALSSVGACARRDPADRAATPSPKCENVCDVPLKAFRASPTRRYFEKMQRFDWTMSPMALSRFGPAIGHSRPAGVSGNHLNDSHHAFVFVIDCMTMVNEPADDHGISERDHDLEYTRPPVCRGRHRKRVAQAIVAPVNAAGPQSPGTVFGECGSCDTVDPRSPPSTLLYRRARRFGRCAPRRRRGHQS